MATFIVERRLEGLSLEHLAAVHRALAESCRRLSAGGEWISYVRSTFAPVGARCVCLFESTSRDLVRLVNEVAQVPFESIEEAIDVENPGHHPRERKEGSSDLEGSSS